MKTPRGVGLHITEDVRKHSAEQGIAEEEALKKGMEEKSKEFIAACPDFPQVVSHESFVHCG